MNLSFLKGKYGLQILLLLIIVFSSSLIFGLLSLFFVAFYEGGSIDDIAKGVESGENTISLVSQYVLIALNQIGTFLLPAIIFAGLFRKKRDYLKIRFAIKQKFWIAIVPITLSGMVMVTYLAQINESLPFPDKVLELEEQARNTTYTILDAKGIGGLLLNLVLIGILPAIAEEFIFRGVLQKLLIKLTKNHHLGIFLAAFIFSFIHFQFLTFLPRFFMGIMLGYLFVWSKSIIVPILGHIINNALGIVVFYLFRDSFEQETGMYLLLLISIVVFGILCYWLSENFEELEEV